MYFQLYALIFLISFFSLIILFLYSGIRLAKWHANKETLDKTPGLQVVEGAIFALLALLVTFTFSSAHHRFEVRRNLITKEANAVRTAYMRVDLASPDMQILLRQNFKQYLFYRIASYKKLPDKKASKLDHVKAQALQKKIWSLTIDICKSKEQQRVCFLLLPPINTMIEIENTRYANSDVHPPLIIFVFLIGMALLGALLAGYDIGERGNGSLLYLISYALVMAVTVYIIIDLEFPRLGFIRLDSFDNVLMQVYTNMS